MFRQPESIVPQVTLGRASLAVAVGGHSVGASRQDPAMTPSDPPVSRYLSCLFYHHHMLLPWHRCVTALQHVLACIPDWESPAD